METKRHFKDQDFLCFLDKHDGYVVHFKLYNVVGSIENGTLLLEGENCQPVENREDAFIYLSGHVKWDGCSNWRFDEQDGCMLHACTREELARFSEAMQLCYDWANEILDIDNR